MRFHVNKYPVPCFYRSLFFTVQVDSEGHHSISQLLNNHNLNQQYAQWTEETQSGSMHIRYV